MTSRKKGDRMRAQSIGNPFTSEEPVFSVAPKGCAAIVIEGDAAPCCFCLTRAGGHPGEKEHER